MSVMAARGPVCSDTPAPRPDLSGGDDRCASCFLAFVWRRRGRPAAHSSGLGGLDALVEQRECHKVFARYPLKSESTTSRCVPPCCCVPSVPWVPLFGHPDTHARPADRVM